ncbi:MAG: glutathione S-transferase N-terminal domain-containing protein [Rhodoplanes sp.]|nr:glutathione S-transferase N-terminal domain-containing protein [Rhodoplanes sp.]
MARSPKRPSRPSSRRSGSAAKRTPSRTAAPKAGASASPKPTAKRTTAKTSPKVKTIAKGRAPAKATPRVAVPARSTKTVARGGAQRTPAKRQAPIELFYWSTPNGWKISIMLEECRLPYVVRPVNITKGEQFAPSFLAIAPNNRMPAIVDPDGPGRRPISVFESGAILQYLGRKTGKLYPADERGRVEVEQWLMWQMGGLGPMAGQAHHFRGYAPEQIPYAIKRYTDECHRLYGVMNRRLADRPFLAGKYSIADIACIGWASRHERQGVDLAAFPHLARWLDTMLARPAVARGMAVQAGEAAQVDMKDPAVQAVLFGQRAPG